MSEVPTADLIGNFVKSTNIGIIKKPPPTPTNPVTEPSKAPKKIING